MITKERNIKELCSFFVSDFHFEMIILPYINKKLDENYSIQIISENDLTDSINILLNKINLNKNNKNQILNLNWKNNKFQKIESKTAIFIKGAEEFINKNNEIIEQTNINNEIIIINCYDLEEIKPKMDAIVKKYKKVLNILGENEF